jgi:uncharacterized protein involved in response to NO
MPEGRILNSLPPIAPASCKTPRAEFTPEEIMDAARARERALSRLLMAFISSGLFFMLLPGTFLGVWNLLKITGHESARSVSPAWLQAHGHAQVFGWVGSFILGIGFYSIPKLRGVAQFRLTWMWACWVLWTSGVALRWLASVYDWHWRLLLPLTAAFELSAFLIFFRTVSKHRPETSGKSRLDLWIWVVTSACVGLFSVLLLNFASTAWLALNGSSPALPHSFDQRYLALMTWGFLVLFVWGFSAKWMSVFLGLKPVQPRLLLTAVALNVIGVLWTFLGWFLPASAIFVLGTVFAIAALRMFEPKEREGKIRGVHSTFPLFVRLAYVWLLIAALLGVAAARWDSSGGIWGASRHALTVGFVAVVVFSVGQRILPAFAGMRLLWSTRLMFVGLLLLVVGCTLRVPGELLAYQGYADWAWSVLPISATLELAGITVFAVNIAGTFLLEPSNAHKQSLFVGMPQKFDSPLQRVIHEERPVGVQQK